MQEIWVQSLVGEDPLEQEMATHSRVLAWKIPWIEKPGGLQSSGSQRVRHDWATEHIAHTVGVSLVTWCLFLWMGARFPTWYTWTYIELRPPCWWPCWVSGMLDSNPSEHPSPVTIFSQKAQGSWHWDVSLATWGEAHVWDALLSLFAQAKVPKNQTKPHSHDSSKKNCKSLKLRNKNQ